MIIKTKKKCKKCASDIYVEKCSDGDSRWKNIYCSNWCWVIETPRKQMKENHAFAEYEMRNGKSYMRSDKHPEFSEVIVVKTTKGLKIQRLKEHLL